MLDESPRISFDAQIESTPMQGDKVVKMNIDGVDASIEGIVQVDIPASWASLSVEGEARVGSAVSSVFI